MSLNKATTTNIRSNFNLGGDEIKCNELFVKNLKYIIFTKTKFTPAVYINDENTIPTSIVENNCYFYTTGEHLIFFGNIQLVYLGPTITPPNIYLTIPTDLESKIGSPTVCSIGSFIGLILNQFQQDFSVLYESSLSLTPLNSLPSLRLNFVDEQNGADVSSSIYYLTFQSTFKLN